MKDVQEEVNNWELKEQSAWNGIPKGTEFGAEGQKPEAEQVGVGAGRWWKTMTKTFCKGSVLVLLRVHDGVVRNLDKNYFLKWNFQYYMAHAF